MLTQLRTLQRPRSPITIVLASAAQATEPAGGVYDRLPEDRRQIARNQKMIEKELERQGAWSSGSSSRRARARGPVARRPVGQAESLHPTLRRSILSPPMPPPPSTRTASMPRRSGTRLAVARDRCARTCSEKSPTRRSTPTPPTRQPSIPRGASRADPRRDHCPRPDGGLGRGELGEVATTMRAKTKVDLAALEQEIGRAPFFVHPIDDRIVEASRRPPTGSRRSS